MGYEDYFYGGNLCFLEWPELIESFYQKMSPKFTSPQKQTAPAPSLSNPAQKQENQSHI